MVFDKDEQQLLIALVKAQQETECFMRGFAEPTKDEEKRTECYNTLIRKIKIN